MQRHCCLVECRSRHEEMIADLRAQYAVVEALEEMLAAAEEEMLAAADSLAEEQEMLAAEEEESLEGDNGEALAIALVGEGLDLGTLHHAQLMILIRLIPRPIAMPTHHIVVASYKQKRHGKTRCPHFTIYVYADFCLAEDDQ